MSRYAARWRREASCSSRAGSPRSHPSVTSRTIAPRPRTRRDQRRLNSCSASPMRVPPDQSETARETCASAASGRRSRSWGVIRVGRGHRGEVRPTKELCRARHHPSGALDRGCHAARHHSDGNLDLTRLGFWAAPTRDGHREASAAEERPEEIESQIKRGEVSLPGDERCAAGGAHVVRALEVDLRDRLEVHPRALRVHVESSAPKKSRKDQEVTRDTVADRRRHIVTGASSFALMQAKSCCVIFSAAPCMSRAPTCWIIPDTVTSLDHSIIVCVSSNSARSMLLTICTALPGAWPRARTAACWGRSSSRNSTFIAKVLLIGPTPARTTTLK